MQSLPSLLKFHNIYNLLSLCLLNSYYAVLWQRLLNTCSDQASKMHFLSELKFMWKEADRKHLHDPDVLGPAVGFVLYGALL